MGDFEYESSDYSESDNSGEEEEQRFVLEYLPDNQDDVIVMAALFSVGMLYTFLLLYFRGYNDFLYFFLNLK